MKRNKHLLFESKLLLNTCNSFLDLLKSILCLMNIKYFISVCVLHMLLLLLNLNLCYLFVCFLKKEVN